eukprot:NODE_542_length_753_cov_371.605431_g533_i0.p1 GENE.NODE_542_length_753_cov_371.605431_g533_i0~~NODE_542_length_753_cov_371.605431_g533_i0.p1  ORF type:complete len:192 (-),score=47.96 NODE_542_length_753_cov_371.605431_g533_i0:177-683(-)
MALLEISLPNIQPLELEAPPRIGTSLHVNDRVTMIDCVTGVKQFWGRILGSQDWPSTAQRKHPNCNEFLAAMDIPSTGGNSGDLILDRLGRPIGNLVTCTLNQYHFLKLDQLYNQLPNMVEVPYSLSKGTRKAPFPRSKEGRELFNAAVGSCGLGDDQVESSFLFWDT